MVDFDLSLSVYKFLYRSAGDELLELLADMDCVLLTDNHFLLGRWLNSAKALASNDNVRLYCVL